MVFDPLAKPEAWLQHEGSSNKENTIHPMCEMHSTTDVRIGYAEGPTDPTTGQLATKQLIHLFGGIRGPALHFDSLCAFALTLAGDFCCLENFAAARHRSLSYPRQIQECKLTGNTRPS